MTFSRPFIVDGRPVYLRDVGLMTTGERAGLDPVTIREVREESASDAEAARKLGCSAALVAKVRRDGVKDANAANPMDRQFSRADAELLRRISEVMQNGGSFGAASIAVSLGEPEAAVRRILDLLHALGCVERVAGHGWIMPDIDMKEASRRVLTDMRPEVGISRICPRDRGHGYSLGKYCDKCHARLGKATQ